ncbi:SRPBCC family protein [Georgenia daeguensis]|uniref:SRPBCC family protein n=1 Tax=Georgenia daeguensis TaxID=908355 RepID=A0ABP8ETP9_9MICO
MARIAFEVDSPLPPETVLAHLTNFGDRRPHLWPAIDPRTYQVHALGEGWADVTEGSDVLGGIWARERYDWSEPGVVTATLQDSNFWHPGGTWELRATSGPGGGSRLRVVRDRRARRPRAALLEVVLTVAGRRLLARELRRAPALGLVEAPDQPQPGRRRP